MAPLMLLLLILSEAASDVIELTVDPGDNATLPCQAADSSIRAVAWSRPDLEPDIILYYSDGHLDPTYQNPSFKDRVDLVDRELKDGDVSLILKNVSSIDNGTYECRVTSADFRRKKRAVIDSEPIRTIRLQVTEPADPNSGNSMNENSMNDVPEDGNSSPGGRYLGLAAGVLVGLLLVAAAVVGVLMYKRHKDKRSGQPAAAADDDEALGDKLV
ncbi:hepatitis A virus cellular receptor 2-like isoform X1 [Sander lucioperca]|uniref:hepatitis A virus cellular receptor 2-like isoform X1 n=1 Tax=Sander lucioperca TaxID=283035 RepID=UPI001653CEC1|nr:hepatitis A virus cellular receptor 2-like isoform X1 [Sander lucioperca]